jgi:polar amino acid transport system permease protein
LVFKVLVELSYYTNLIHSRNFRAFEATFIATGLYLVLAVALRQSLGWAGARLLTVQRPK